MKTTNAKGCVLALLGLVASSAWAAPLWQGQGRIAISSDGNEHDKDDWGATALTLAILSHAGLQNRLVSYTFSDHIWSSENATWEAEMRESARGGARRFGYDTTRFVEAVKNKQLAFERVRDAIDASSATNPLFLICAGPMEVCWQGANMANPQKRAFVTAISHSLWNDKHADTDHNGHNWNDLGTLGLKLVHIKDQNAGLNTSQNYAPWAFLKNSTDANLRWVYSRGEAEDKADYSDAGMAWFLIKGDEDGNTAKLTTFFAAPKAAVLPPADGGGPVVGNPLVLDATTDFPKIALTGMVPFVADAARSALSINAANLAYRDAWAGAQAVFAGASGTYDLALTALLELDGESPYRILVNGKVVAEFKNQGTKTDYVPQVHLATAIPVSKGDTLVVQAKAVTNGLVPEGTGTAYSRGRWTNLTLTSSTVVPPPPTGTTSAWIEAESVTPVSSWAFSKSLEGYSGTGYLEWTAGDKTAEPVAGTRGMVYSFSVSKAGTYVVELRGRRDQTGLCAGALSDACNDVFTRIDTHEWFKTMIKGPWGQWFWQSGIETAPSTITPAHYELTAGNHTLEILGRSKGVKLDAMRIYLKGTTAPTGPGTTSVGRSRSLPVEGPFVVMDLRGRVLGAYPDRDGLDAAVLNLPAGVPWVVRSNNGSLLKIGLDR
jgi:hypothetical protein